VKSFITPHPQEQPSLTGDWHGILKTGAMELRLVFHLKQKPDGGYEGTMDSPDQGAMGIPLSEVMSGGTQADATRGKHSG
jgi:uncharacterized protein